MTDIYCAEQINIPADLPEILKQFTKSAIRSQPKDLAAWAAEYFQNLNEGKAQQPAGDLPLVSSASKSVSVEQLNKVQAKLAEGERLKPKDSIVAACTAAGIAAGALQETLQLGGFTDSIDWLKFVALLCAHVQPGLQATVHTAIDVLGTDGKISIDNFVDIYGFLAGLDVDTPAEQTQATITAAKALADAHGGAIAASDLSALSN